MISFYMNQHVPRAITEGLRLRGVDVTTAYEDGASEMGDSELLDRATELGRVLFTQDDDLLAEAAIRQRKGIPFSEFANLKRYRCQFIVTEKRKNTLSEASLFLVQKPAGWEVHITR